MENFKQLIPYTGSYTGHNSYNIVQRGNFMWHGMTAYNWFHQSEEDIKSTIDSLKNLLESKQEMKKMLRSQLENFDWTHMYSDSSQCSEKQKKRNKEFNECIALAPDDVKEYMYRRFIISYLHFSPSPKNPISYEEFIAGIRV